MSSPSAFIPFVIAAVGLTVVAPLLRLPGKRFAVACLAAVLGVIASFPISTGLVKLFDFYEVAFQTLLLFFGPAFLGPAAIALAERLQRKPISRRGIVSSIALSTTLQTIILSQRLEPYVGDPAEWVAVAGLVAAPAVVATLAYGVAAWKTWPWQREKVHKVPW